MAVPLPCPSHLKLNDPAAHQTIFEYPSLFKIITPMNVDLLEHLLSDHPNPAFVKSVCISLHEGFWPWADTLKDSYPPTYDGARPTPCDDKKADFIHAQQDIEISKNHFSASFGPDLFPGMYCMPAHAIPKPNSMDLHMVTDHSTGPFSLNSMVDHDQVIGYPMDNITHMGEVLAHHRLTTSARRTVVWKSNITEAYCLIPLHPY